MVKAQHLLPTLSLLGSALAAFPHMLGAGSARHPSSAVLEKRTPPAAKNTIVQMFEWNWVRLCG